MSEKSYKKKYEFQKKLNLRQAEHIEFLKREIEELKFQCEEKDKIIASVDSLRGELTENTNNIKEKKKEYQELIQELREMKRVMNQEFFKGRWKLIKFLIK